jgi:hypothetical protein
MSVRVWNGRENRYKFYYYYRWKVTGKAKTDEVGGDKQAEGEEEEGGGGW